MKLPASHVMLRSGAVRAAIRRDLVATLGPWLLAPRLIVPSRAEPVATGRGAAFRVELADGTRVVVRLYRRGGLVARFVRETYAGLWPRPLRELVVTAEARRRGVPAAEVLAARVEGGFLYRGALVTAELATAVTLVDALRGAPDAGVRSALAASAGRAIAALHHAGVFHADLNLTNIMVRRGPDGGDVTLLDFDRARVRRGPLASAARRRNLRRLARSVAKLDPAGQVTGPEERRAFGRAYGGGEGGCGS